MTKQTNTVQVTRKFWLFLREPGQVPRRKGPWPIRQSAAILREFMAANPTAYIDYVTVGDDGSPEPQHGPEVLQMLDGRSMATGRKHNQRVRDAEARLAQSTPADAQGLGLVELIRSGYEEASEKLGKHKPGTLEHANAVGAWNVLSGLLATLRTAADPEPAGRVGALVEGHIADIGEEPFVVLRDADGNWMTRTLEAHLALTKPAGAQEVDLLRRMAKHTNWELSFTEWDEELEDWQVHAINGGRNDREWTLIGSGSTPAEAILAALQAQQKVEVK